MPLFLHAAHFVVVSPLSRPMLRWPPDAQRLRYALTALAGLARLGSIAARYRGLRTRHD